LPIKWRLCRDAEQEHRKDERQYAHTFHYANTICVCRAFWDLPKSYRDGVLLHEIGHLLVGPEGTEQEATRAAEDVFKARIDYVDSPYGRSVERLGNMPRRVRLTRRPNPSHDELPYDEWIPAHAIMFNDDGTISVMKEADRSVHTLHNVGSRWFKRKANTRKR
jgi:hypothetical protein